MFKKGQSLVATIRMAIIQISVADPFAAQSVIELGRDKRWCYRPSDVEDVNEAKGFLFHCFWLNTHNYMPPRSK